MLSNVFSGTPNTKPRAATSLDTPAKPVQPSSSVQATVVPEPEPSPTAALTVAAEYVALRNASHCPTGIYLTPSLESLLEWNGVFFIHKGYYSSSVLRFRLNFPPNYPERPPAVFFTTDVFHPLVSQVDGSFALGSRFAPWRPKEHHVFDVLYWIKAAFKKPALDQLSEKDCTNKEAFRYRESITSFAALALQTSGLSQSPSALYDRDHPHMGGRNQGGVVFRPLDAKELEKMRKVVGVTEWKTDREDKRKSRTIPPS